MSRRFELVFTGEFLRKVKKLNKEDQIRILRELRILEEKPLAGKRLMGRLSGLLSFRVGDYRIIYQLLGNKVIIRTIGHRRTVYKE